MEFEYEERRYRAPDDDLAQMEVYVEADDEWVPYLGDVARVLLEGSPSETPEGVSLTHRDKLLLLSAGYPADTVLALAEPAAREDWGDVARRAWVTRRANMEARQAQARAEGRAAPPPPPRQRGRRAAPPPPPKIERSPTAQRRYDEWKAARGAAQAPGSPGRLTEPSPGEAGYRPPLERAVVETSLTPEHLGTAKRTSELGTENNVNTSYKIQLQDGSVHAFKPVDGEKFTLNGMLVRQAITNRNARLAEREVLAARMDKVLGLNLVAPTKLAKVEYTDPLTGETKVGIGSLAEFVPARDISDSDSVSAWKETPKGDRARMGIFDAVIGNLDRHRGNYLVTEDNRLKAIDHGYSFGDSKVIPGGGYGGGVKELRSFALGNDQIKRGDMPLAEQRDIADRLEKINWTTFFHGSHLNEQEKESAKQRAKWVAHYLKEGRAHDLNTLFQARPR